MKTVKLKSFPDHKGRPGKQGGSLPKRESVNISMRDMLEYVDNKNISGRDFSRLVGKTIADKWNPSDKTLSILNDEEKWGDLTKEQIVGSYLAQWTGSSGGPIPSVMIDAAAKTNGIKLQNDIIDAAVNNWMNNNPTVRKDIEDLGNIIYKNTQNWFKDKRISEIVLYRKGTNSDSEKSVTSWSTEFGAFISTETNRISYEATIPVKYIFSLANTGFGNVKEREAVVIGNVSEFINKQKELKSFNGLVHDDLIVKRNNSSNIYYIAKELLQFDELSRNNPDIQRMVIIDSDDNVNDNDVVQTITRKEIKEQFDISNIYAQMFTKSHEYFKETNKTFPTLADNNEILKTINAAISKELGLEYSISEGAYNEKS